MDAKDILNLQEAYMEVVENQQLDEALTGERYKKVMKKPGGMAYSRMVSANPSKRATRGGRGGESDFGAGDRGSGNKAARRAGTYGEGCDLYDIILSHLLDEGYAETPKAAEAIMVNMSEEWREEIMEGLDMKTFKANRKKAKASAARADAVKRGHVGKEWYNSGRRYSPDEAKRSRANMDDEERRTRHRSAVDPDSEDDSSFSADKTKNPKKLRKQKAMGELG